MKLRDFADALDDIPGPMWDLDYKVVSIATLGEDKLVLVHPDFAPIIWNTHSRIWEPLELFMGALPPSGA